MRNYWTGACLLFSAAMLLAQPSPGSAPQPTEPSASAAGFNLPAIDKTANPCTDFYQYACGAWMKQNPIPESEAMWGRFDELMERNRVILRDILDKAAASDPKRDAIAEKIGDFYAACMDEKGIEQRGTEPIKDELARIQALPDKKAVIEEIARLHAEGVNVFFQFGSGPDYKDPAQNIAQIDQGGLGLPDRDYYFRSDPDSAKLRQQYQQHVAKMFELLGAASKQAAANATTVMRIETALADGSQDLVSRRDPEKTYHKLNMQEFIALAPAFEWPKYFTRAGAPPMANVDVIAPEFFKRMQTLFEQTSLEDWKTYMRWQLVHGAAPLLSSAFVNAHFDFYGRTLTGAKELKPRWKRCVSHTDDQLGEALGQKYVEQTFGAEGKERTLKMALEIERALGQDIQQLTWMTPDTKKKALEKLHQITEKIGYPDKWRDYSSIKITRDDALGNEWRATEFEYRRQIAKIGKPVDRAEWDMTPPTVNAYYRPDMNNINFPAGILQPPFFDKQADDAVNLGAIGAVIGHELTHGFDDQGRKFDGKETCRIGGCLRTLRDSSGALAV